MVILFPITRELYAALEEYKHWTSHGNLKVRGLMLSYLITVGQPSFNFSIENVRIYRGCRGRYGQAGFDISYKMIGIWKQNQIPSKLEHGTSGTGFLQLTVLVANQTILKCRSDGLCSYQVDSNDRLYGQNKRYLAQVDELLNTVIVKIVSFLDAIGNCNIIHG